ncbi:ABC transporter permease [Zhihengliuella halotolerans]|uniref:MacB-like protein n=1 Tax=Zhihengliuella halotolerans TaxID=370736 RepID=A0A4Q8AFD1_9MICC|nr:ABC transporter permease [Zhihengliuella halotolerans]RZU62924.1 hypothetical protein EV380_2529 [Zhihengliuella halotolerans]
MELIFDLRRNWAILGGKAAVWALLVLTVFNVSSFTSSSNAAVDQSFSQDADVNMYGIVDMLAEPDAFDEFRHSRENLEQLGDFYNELNANKEFDLLSAFASALPLRDFPGDTAFQHGYGDEMTVNGPFEGPDGNTVLDVKSMSINRAAFDFYRLEVAEGRVFDWDAVDYSSGTVPVLLGSSYSDLYEVGDLIDGYLWFEPRQFEIAGILDERASMYYQGELNQYLDHYVLIPYPSVLGDFAADEQSLAGMLYFEMINANVAAPKELSADQVLREIAAASEASGFDQYSLLNLPTYLVQFSLVKSVIQGNAALVQAIGAMLFLGVVVASGFANWQLMRRRRNKTLVFLRLGRSQHAISRMFVRSSMIGYGLTFLATAVAVRMVPASSSGALFTALWVFVLLVVLDSAHQHYLLRRCLDVDSGKAASL